MINLKKSLGSFLLITSLAPLSIAAPFEDPNDKDFNLIVNGASYHFKRSGLNEKNYGLGFSYKIADSDMRPDFLKGEALYLEGDVFKDSFSKLGIAAAVTWKQPVLEHFQFGLKTGLLKSDHMKDEFDLPIVPYIVPFIETDFKFPVNLRTTVIPPLGDVTYGYMMFQLIVDTDL